MRDDATIHKIFDRRDESDKEIDDNKSDDDGMDDKHAAILRLQTIGGPELPEALKKIQEDDPNALKSTQSLMDNMAE